MPELDKFDTPGLECGRQRASKRIVVKGWEKRRQQQCKFSQLVCKLVGDHNYFYSPEPPAFKSSRNVALAEDFSPIAREMVNALVVIFVVVNKHKLMLFLVLFLAWLETVSWIPPWWKPTGNTGLFQTEIWPHKMTDQLILSDIPNQSVQKNCYSKKFKMCIYLHVNLPSFCF